LQAADNTQVTLVELLGDAMRSLAYKTLHPGSSSVSAPSTDLSKCDTFGPPKRTPLPVDFDAQVSRAEEYYGGVVKLTTSMHQYWPGNQLFGVLDNHEGMLYAIEFEMSKAHPGQYPDSLAKAKGAYADSLAILTHASGPGAAIVQIVAQNYLDLLIEAGLTDEAKKIETAYGVSPSADSK
jgi:hypothetical protein